MSLGDPKRALLPSVHTLYCLLCLNLDCPVTCFWPKESGKDDTTPVSGIRSIKMAQWLLLLAPPESSRHHKWSSTTPRPSCEKAHSNHTKRLPEEDVLDTTWAGIHHLGLFSPMRHHVEWRGGLPKLENCKQRRAPVVLSLEVVTWFTK